MCRPSLISTLFPYTTLFRSNNFVTRQGFNRQMTLDEPTQLGKVIAQSAKTLFNQHWSGYPIRAVGVNLAQLTQEKGDRKSTRLNSSHVAISYAVFCLKKKTQ